MLILNYNTFSWNKISNLSGNLSTLFVNKRFQAFDIKTASTINSGEFIPPLISIDAKVMLCNGADVDNSDNLFNR